MASSPWKVTVTRSGYGGRKHTQTHYMGHADLKRCTRWVHVLSTPSQISNIKVERCNKYSLKPKDSYRVTLKIKCLSEVEMGSICCASPMIEYNPKKYLQHITDKKVYCKVWIYESLRAEQRGVSATNAYQSAADQYNMFMNELTEIWRGQMTETLIKKQIIEEKTVDKDQPLSRAQMYETVNRLHKRCKNKKTNAVWDDMQKAFDKSFGPLDDKSKKFGARTTPNEPSKPPTPATPRYFMRSHR